MNAVQRSPITRDEAQSLNLIPIASKSAGDETYRPSFRIVSAIVPEPDFREFPGFVVEESASSRGSNFYRVATLEEVAAVFAEPLA